MDLKKKYNFTKYMIAYAEKKKDKILKFEKEKIINIIKNWRDPFFFRDILLNKLIPFLYRNVEGFSIFSEYWDNLIILDACRYDIFEYIYKKHKLEGTLYKKVSKGAHTVSFLFQNFKKKEYKDIIYLTSNPYVNKILKNKFYKIVSVWENGWNEKYKTVLPKTMLDYTIEVMNKYPEKRLIIHFMQPHYPYLGCNIIDGSVQELRKSASNNLEFDFKQKLDYSLFSIYSSKIYYMLDINTQIKEYIKNLEFTIPYIKKLIEILPNKIIITSDHGEAFGEKIHKLIPIRFYGHMRGIKIPSTINIPWLVIDSKRNYHLIKKKQLEEQEIRSAIISLKKKKVI